MPATTPPYPNLTNDLYQTWRPAILIGKQRAYILINTFDVTYLLKTAPYIFAVFQYASTRDFVLTNIPARPADSNYILCIKYSLDDGTVARYKIWYDEEDLLLPQVEAYVQQKIKANFTIELWSTELADAPEMLPAGFESIFQNTEQACAFDGNITIEAGTISSFVSQDDANNQAISNLVCPPEPDTPDPEFLPDLNGLRFEIPCGSCAITVQGRCFVCNCTSPADQTVTLVGDPLKTYNVKLGFIGFFELSNAITGGDRGDATQPYFALDANVAADPSGFNVYSLVMSNPAGIAYLNKGIGASQEPFIIQYTATIQMVGNSTLTLHADVKDGRQLTNFYNLVVPGISPAPLPYNGQLMQISVIEISEV